MGGIIGLQVAQFPRRILEALFAILIEILPENIILFQRELGKGFFSFSSSAPGP